MENGQLLGRVHAVESQIQGLKSCGFTYTFLEKLILVFSMFIGEKEGAAKSLDSCQELLTESKSENAQLLGRVHAAESQIQGLKKGKEEVIHVL